MRHRQCPLTPTPLDSTHAAVMVPRSTYPPLPPISTLFRIAGAATHESGLPYPPETTFRALTTTFPYGHPIYPSPNPPSHATGSPPDPTPDIFPILLHNPDSSQAYPTHLPPLFPPLSFSYSGLPAVPSHRGRGPLFAIEHASQLHPASKESKLRVRYHPGLDSGLPLETVCAVSGSRPLKRRRTDRRLPDQGISAQQTSISSLNHDVLLEIFDWYFPQSESNYLGARVAGPFVLKFRAAIHVCRTWRHLILRFSKRFHLEIYCTFGTPVADLLTHFPLLPIKLGFGAGRNATLTTKDEEGILRAMEQSHRLCCVRVHAPYRAMQRIFAATNGQFPLLEELQLTYTEPHDPDVNRSLASTTKLSQARTFAFPSVLSAPRPDPLQSENATPLIEPPILPHLPALTYLTLFDIPSAVLLPPELLVQLLSAMPLLGSLHIGYRFPGLHRDTRTATIPRCTSLPRLRWLWFKGACGYFDDLVSQISAPSLRDLVVTFFNGVPLDPPNLGSPFLRLWQSLVAKDTKASIAFMGGFVRIGQGKCIWVLLSRQFDWQVASAAEFCQSLGPALLSVIELKLRSEAQNMPSGRHDGSEPQDWCNLLRPFSNVKKLQVHPALYRDVSHALMSNGAQASLDLLPELQTLELMGDDDDGAKAFGDFLEARERANRPVSIV